MDQQTKNDMLMAASEAGYFRAKKDSSREGIAAEVASVNQWDNAALLAVLTAESERRASEAKRKEAAKLAKEQAKAARPVSAGADTATDHVRTMGPGLYVVTTAQNNTDVDADMMAALHTYCVHNGAQLLVAKTTYNKTGFLQPDVAADELWYAPEIKPYLVSGQIDLGGVHFLADANVLPTAKNPLTGFGACTPNGVHIIVPAVKIALQCLAALKGMAGKLVFSTGAITKRNYILRRAGAVASSEHNIGALVVDTRNGGFTVRQLERMAEWAGFYDEGKYYSADGVSEYNTADVLQFGDIHAEKMEHRNLVKLREQIAAYRPAHIMLHDVMDFSSRNHHNVKDPVFIFQQQVNGNTVEKDIKAVSRVIDTLVGDAIDHNENAVVHIIESNHDLAINTWLKNADFKLDPVNAVVYLTCMLKWYQHTQEKPGETFNMLGYVYDAIGNGGYAGSPELVFHETDESVMIAGVEHGNHGHTGVNGSRGSPAQFRSLGVAMNTGHTHTPSICGNVYTAGVSGSLEMGYNVGASSWQLASIVTWPNGQRQIIFM